MDPRDAEAPGWETEGRATSKACGPLPTVHALSGAGTHDALSREFVDGFEYGYQYGIAAGRQQAEDEQRGRGAVSAAIAAQVARMGPADELEERRGRPERAARLRQIMAERGITA